MVAPHPSFSSFHPLCGPHLLLLYPLKSSGNKVVAVVAAAPAAPAQVHLTLWQPLDPCTPARWRLGATSSTRPQWHRPPWCSSQRSPGLLPAWLPAWCCPSPLSPCEAACARPHCHGLSWKQKDWGPAAWGEERQREPDQAAAGRTSRSADHTTICCCWWIGQAPLWSKWGFCMLMV